MYVVTDQKYYLGKDQFNRPSMVHTKERATLFKSETAAINFLQSIPEILRGYEWCVKERDPETGEDRSVMRYSGSVLAKMDAGMRVTPLEEEGFDIFEFFSEVVRVMSHIDQFIANMVRQEQQTEMKILDVRHYIRDNEHRLNAIQMQRLGYYLQGLEKERYGYKSKRLIASMYADRIDALKDASTIGRMEDIQNSKYRPRALSDTDIEAIINKKKEGE